jgi:hypothetical protein
MSKNIKKSSPFKIIFKNITIDSLLKDDDNDDTSSLNLQSDSEVEISNHKTVSKKKNKINKEEIGTTMFLDQNKTKVLLRINMYDEVSNKQLPIYTDKPCWWCREKFKTSPLGLPLRYFAKDNNTKIKKEVTKHLNISNIDPKDFDFFETEGLFCSFPCCKAYILDQNDIRYQKSVTLLSLLYFRLYGEIININSAPSWKVIDKWGGHLSIEEFRDSFCKVTYIITPNIKRPFMFSCGALIEEKQYN